MTTAQFNRLVGRPITDYAADCHAASIALVKALGLGHRVARGTCEGVFGQHSWVVVGMDCYDPDADVIDPTLWSYDASVAGVWTGKNMLRHRPHGTGSIWTWGRPPAATDDPIALDMSGMSAAARDFLGLLGPLDRRGWMCLASDAPVQGWPAGEILGAMWQDETLSACVPIDRVGMLTTLNPGGLYLPQEQYVANLFGTFQQPRWSR